MFDLIIRNGKIFDGTGGPSFHADIAVKDGKIAKVSKVIRDSAEREIDAAGLTVTPGFIDSHAHNDSWVLPQPLQKEKIEQGITTSIGGQCGGSPAPCTKKPEDCETIGEFGLACDVYKDMGTFLSIAKTVPQGANSMVLIGHNTVRNAVMGNAFRAPTEQELNKMKDYVRDAMEHGALGLSFGLGYNPGCYSDVPEMAALAKVAAEYGGVVTAHIRNEGDNVAAAVKEFLQVLRLSGARGVVSHIKSSDREENWGKVHNLMRLIDEANAEGLDVYADVYPYNAYNTSLLPIFAPIEFRANTKEVMIEELKKPEVRAQLRKRNVERYGREDLHWVQLNTIVNAPQYEGKRMSEVAHMMGKEDHYDALFDLLIINNLNGMACYFGISDDDVCAIMGYERAMIGTDSGVGRPGLTRYHPRLRGSFPRTLGRYVREKGACTMPEMIRKMTSMPAAVYGLDTKGLIKVNMDADICIFDEDKIIDGSDYAHCDLKNHGLSYVIVGGKIAAIDGEATGEKGGRVITREF